MLSKQYNSFCYVSPTLNALKFEMIKHSCKLFLANLAKPSRKKVGRQVWIISYKMSIWSFAMVICILGTKQGTGSTSRWRIWYKNSLHELNCVSVTLIGIGNTSPDPFSQLHKRYFPSKPPVIAYSRSLFNVSSKNLRMGKRSQFLWSTNSCLILMNKIRSF